jgi:hypothetical protein
MGVKIMKERETQKPKARWFRKVVFNYKEWTDENGNLAREWHEIPPIFDTVLLEDFHVYLGDGLLEKRKADKMNKRD